MVRRMTAASLALLAGLVSGVACAAEGPFRPTWESLESYQCPEWFRDAKLGIFMHWGPCSVPGVDDWYGRNMYIQGHPAYEHHVKTYGHPSKFGYKDIVALWKAEHFDPDRLARLYKQAGARYVVPVAVHHDNFDLWDSKHHRFNSVNMGPKKDIVGLWREACRKHGLRFGVSAHLARSYCWFQTSHGADKKGPLAGVPYDGADPRFADFYHPRDDDTGFRYPVSPPDAWKQEWYDRVEDLVDSYHPDLLYFDGGIPFGEVGRRLVAHYYNANMQWHGGRLEAVLNIKKWESGHGDYRDGVAVRDMERGVLSGIVKDPWQNDTSIGPWFWRDPPRYRSVDSIVDLLVDVVAKNGNLLLNVPLKPDGTLDPAAEQILVDLGRWMDVCGEAIYGTRPWKTFGEGPTTIREGHFNEGSGRFTGRDIRFTAKGDCVYAICLAWPGDQLTIKSLAAHSPLCPKQIAEVALLGSASRPVWSRGEDGLTVKMPTQRPCRYAFVLRVKLKP